MVWELTDRLSQEDIEKLDCPKQTTVQVRREGVVVCYRYSISPPCNCLVCLQQFRGFQEQFTKTYGYKEGLSDLEAMVFASVYAMDIKEDFTYLKVQCTMNGNSILKRWKKKSKAARTQIIQKVMPGIFPHQWCDALASMEHFLSLKPEIDRNGGWSDVYHTTGRFKRNDRQRFLLPYVNLEALSNDPMRMLNMLYTRSTHSPKAWAPYDNSLLNGQWTQGAFDLTYNQGCIIMTGNMYGGWTRWDKTAAHNWNIVGFPRGILVLETQQRLLKFLRGFVEEILQGLSRESKIPQSDHFNKALQGGPQRLNVGTLQSTLLESSYLNQPFSAPPAFDVDNLLSIAQTRLDMHGDHLRLLQTEPSFMRRYSDAILAGGHKENLTKQNKHVYISNHVMQEATWFWSWEWMLQQVQQLRNVQMELRESIVPGRALPPRYENVLACTVSLLSEQYKRRAAFIRQIMVRRPGFQHRYKITYRQVKESVLVIPTRKQENYPLWESFKHDRLSFCLEALTIDPDKDRFPNGEPITTRGPEFDPVIVFAMLDDHLNQSARKGERAELNRMDEVLYDLVSDLSAVHQMPFMVKLHVPRAKHMNLEEAQKVGTGKPWRYVRNHFMEQTLFRSLRANGNKNHEVENIYMWESAKSKISAEQRLGSLIGNFMASETPKGPRNSQKWADQSKAQRDTLRDFWKGIRERHAQTLRRLDFDSEDIESDLQVLSADTSPEHLHNLEEEMLRVKATIDAYSAAKDAKRSKKHEMQTQWGNKKGEKVRVEEKIKQKTRGTEQLDESLDLDRLQITESSESAPLQASVSKRALAVFKVMFPSDNLEDRSKSVDWDAFVNAMGEDQVGFVARHSAGGAAYTFEPSETSKWAGMGKIVFHKPHPTAVLDTISGNC